MQEPCPTNSSVGEFPVMRNGTTECWTPSEYDTVAFALDTCVTGCLVVMGIVGNILSIIAFSSYRHKTSTTILLTGLAVFDLLYLAVHALMFQVLRSIYPETGYLKGYHDIWNWIEPFEYPFGVMLQTASVWCVVLVACDRFIGIRWPLKSMRFCTKQRAKWEILCLTICAVVLNFPRFFTQKTVTKFDDCTNTTVAHLEGTDFGWHPAYVWPATVLYIGLIYVVPILVLAIVNASLMLALRKAAKSNRKMTMVRARRSKSDSEKITFMLVLVVLVFLICQIPVGIDHILYAAQVTSWPWPGRGYYSLACNSLVALNSAVNFLIYVLFGKKFRQRLLDICCHCRVGDKYSDRKSFQSSLTLCSARSSSKRSRNGSYSDRLTPTVSFRSNGDSYM